MNEIVAKLLLAGDNFVPGMHLRLDLRIVFVNHLQKKGKKYKHLKKHEIHDIFIKTN